MVITFMILGVVLLNIYTGVESIQFLIQIHFVEMTPTFTKNSDKNDMI